jgi:hypothetical protein
LLEGLTKEAQRRLQYFQDNNVNSIEAYNVRLKEQGTAPLPRIVVLVDSIADEAWKAASERWLPVLQGLVSNGTQVGIHIILTNDSTGLPDGIVIPTQVVMRGAANEVVEKLKDFPRPNLRFVDAFVVEGEQTTPVELCVTSENDLTRTVEYWRQTAAKRKQEAPVTPSTPEVSAKTGVTSVFRGDSQALEVIKARETQSAMQVGSSDSLLQRAGALAAYLGWISVGVLRDVFGTAEAEAQKTIGALQEIGVVEKGDGPAYRFVRLSDNPLENQG